MMTMLMSLVISQMPMEPNLAPLRAPPGPTCNLVILFVIINISTCGHCLPLAMFLSYGLGKVCGRLYVCVRVFWYCRQSGGTDLVDLPDVLLPEGQYLDMFDSESDCSGDLSDDELVEVS